MTRPRPPARCSPRTARLFPLATQPTQRDRRRARPALQRARPEATTLVALAALVITADVLEPHLPPGALAHRRARRRAPRHRHRPRQLRNRPTCPQPISPGRSRLTDAFQRRKTNSACTYYGFSHQSVRSLSTALWKLAPLVKVSSNNRTSCPSTFRVTLFAVITHESMKRRCNAKSISLARLL